MPLEVGPRLLPLWCHLMQRITSILLTAMIIHVLGVSASVAGLVSFQSGGSATAYDIGGIVSDSVNWDDPTNDTPTISLRGLHSIGTFNTALDPTLVTSHFTAKHSVLQTSENQLNAVVGAGFGEVYWFQSDMPLEVTVSGTSSLILSGSNTWGGLGFKLTDRPGHTIYAQVESLVYGQTNETISLNETIFLEGGIEYFILMSSVVFNRVQEIPGAASSAESEMNLTIRVVPEPGTLLCFLFGVIALYSGGGWHFIGGMAKRSVARQSSG